MLYEQVFETQCVDKTELFLVMFTHYNSDMYWWCFVKACLGKSEFPVSLPSGDCDAGSCSLLPVDWEMCYFDMS